MVKHGRPACGTGSPDAGSASVGFARVISYKACCPVSVHRGRGAPGMVTAAYRVRRRISAAFTSAPSARALISPPETSALRCTSVASCAR